MSSSSDIELLKSALAGNYSLGAVHSLTPVSHPSLDATSKSNNLSCFRVEADAGTFWLKSQRLGKDESRMRFEGQFQSRMFESDSALVPKLMRQTNGETELSLLERLWRLESFVNAPHYSWWHPVWSASYCKTAGQALRRFHGGCAQYGHELSVQIGSSGAESLEETDVRTDFATSIQPLGHRSFAVCESALKIAGGKLLGSVTRSDDSPPNSDIEKSRYLVRSCGRLLDASRTIFERIAAFERSLWTADSVSDFVLSHGDYHPGNVLLCEDGHIVVVDFEHVHFEHWMFDVAYGIVMFGVSGDGSTGSTSPEERARAFFAGYSSSGEKTLTISDNGLLSNYEVIACALIAGWLLESLPSTQAVLSKILVIWKERWSKVHQYA